jgi:hypothetical protein
MVNLQPRPSLVAAKKTAYEKQRDFRAKRPADATLAQEPILDAADAFVSRN